MEKKYTRKPIRNLTDLENAQDRTRSMYKDMESDWVSNFLQPDAWAFSVGQYLLTGLLKKKRRKKETFPDPVFRTKPTPLKNRFFGRRTAAAPGKKARFKRLISAISRRFRIRKDQKIRPESIMEDGSASRLLKKLLWSIVYWQVFHIGFRIGREGGRTIRNKKIKKNRR